MNALENAKRRQFAHCLIFTVDKIFYDMEYLRKPFSSSRPEFINEVAGENRHVVMPATRLRSPPGKVIIPYRLKIRGDTEEEGDDFVRLCRHVSPVVGVV